MKIFIFFLFAACLFVHCGGEAGSPLVGPEALAGEGLNLPKFKNEAIKNTGDTVAVDAGFAGNGSKIGLPTGYTADKCKMTAAAAHVQGSALSTTVSINKETGEVICRKVVQEREEVPAETKDCVASYTVICVK